MTQPPVAATPPGNYAPPPYTIAQLVPHSGIMSLLDRTLHCDHQSLIAEVTVGSDTLFVTDKGVPAWVGIEYMAQSVAAFAGVRAKRAGEDIRIGFLVGTRKYHCNSAYFPPGSTLTIRVTEELQGDNGLGVFVCRITSAENSANMIVAEANLNVFQPDNAEEFLNNA